MRRIHCQTGKFRIECDLDYGDSLSYQDSFKWYDEYDRVADNYGHGDIDWDVTDGSINDEEEEEEYDDFHGYHCHETRPVYCHGCEYYCDVENLDEFVWIEKTGNTIMNRMLWNALNVQGIFRKRIHSIQT